MDFRLEVHERDLMSESGEPTLSNYPSAPPEGGLQSVKLSPPVPVMRSRGPLRFLVGVWRAKPRKVSDICKILGIKMKHL